MPVACFDAAVAGASLAGSTTALLLARRGISVALIEPAQFPRQKACGEGLSAGGQAVLKRLGLAPAVLSKPHACCCEFVIWKNEKQYAIPLSATSRVLGISRTILDTLLLAEACRCPSLVRFESAVHAVKLGSRIHEVQLNDRIIRAEFVVLAVGASSGLVNALGFPMARRCGPRIGFSSEWDIDRRSCPGGINILVEDGLEVYCTPVFANRLNIAFLGNKANLLPLKHAGHLEGIAARCLKRIGCEGEMHGKLYGSAGFGRAAALACHDRVLLAGDCCESMDAIGGMGMTHALRSAELAAEAVIRARQEGDSSRSLAGYERSRRRVSASLRGFTRLTYTSLISCKSGSLIRLAPLLGRPLPVDDLIAEEVVDLRPKRVVPKLMMAAAGSDFLRRLIPERR